MVTNTACFRCYSHWIVLDHNSVLTVVMWFAKNPSKSKKLKMVSLVPV